MHSLTLSQKTAATMTNMIERHLSLDEDDSTGVDGYFWQEDKSIPYDCEMVDEEDEDESFFPTSEGGMLDDGFSNHPDENQFYPELPNEESFECVLDNVALEVDPDEESTVPPPPPPPLPEGNKLKTWFRPALIDPDEEQAKKEELEENEKLEHVESPVPSDEGHGGAIVLETPNFIEASDGRDLLHSTTMLTGEQTRVTLIPDTNYGVVQSFHSLWNEQPSFKDEPVPTVMTKDSEFEHRRRNFKCSLMAVACVLVGLTAAVLVLGVQRSLQDDVRQNGTGTTAAATDGAYEAATDDAYEASDSPTSAPTVSPTSAPTVCLNSLESTSPCYTPGSNITVAFKNCEAEIDDWVGFYAVNDNLNASSLGSPLDWMWTCGSKVCIGLPVAGELFFDFSILTSGTYQPFMLHRTPGGPYPSFVSGETFQVLETCP